MLSNTAARESLTLLARQERLRHFLRFVGLPQSYSGNLTKQRKGIRPVPDHIKESLTRYWKDPGKTWRLTPKEEERLAKRERAIRLPLLKKKKKKKRKKKKAKRPPKQKKKKRTPLPKIEAAPESYQFTAALWAQMSRSERADIIYRREKEGLDRMSARETLERMHEVRGGRATARILGVDPSNLRKMRIGERPVSAKVQAGLTGELGRKLLSEHYIEKGYSGTIAWINDPQERAKAIERDQAFIRYLMERFNKSEAVARVIAAGVRRKRDDRQFEDIIFDYKKGAGK